MSSTPFEKRNRLLGETVAKNFDKRGFDACYVDTGKEACEKALSLIGREDVIAWGGCMSAEECGLMDILRGGGYPNIIDRDTAKTPDERMDLMRKAFLADVYIGGANAISEDGQIVNIDGNGNRVAAMTFGPKSVIVIASLDKVCKTADDAVARARMVAAPVNCERFPIETPCRKTGACADCLSPQSICNYFQIIRRCAPKGKIKVILVGEKLGF
ncbi:MAG: lactate utilization protein [Lachnospiraceae bacterium]|nr:lactate utilization protein [Lachnospiraceae bacterium]